MDILFLFVIMFVLMTIGVPIGYSIGGATVLTMVLFTDLDMIIIPQFAFSGLNAFTIMAIPFFMFAGTLMTQGGIAKRVVNVAYDMVGFVTGGLGAVVTLACMFFSAMTGSAMACVAAIGGMMIPEMKKKEYDVPYSTTLCCFAGTLGIIIPPSIPLVIYGVVTQTSITKLFLAGIIPGLLIGIALLITNYIMCKKLKLGIVDKSARMISVKDYAKKLGKSTKEAIWAIFAPVIILGGIYSGIFTPTEAAVIADVYCIIIGFFVYKELTFKTFYKATIDAIIINGITAFLLGLSTAFATYLTMARVPDKVYGLIMGATESKIIVLLVLNVFLLIIGLVVDNIPATIILSPIFLPALVNFGVDPVHFGLIITLNLAIGLCTPPYGCNLFVGAAVAGIKFESMFKYLWPFLFAMLVVLAIVTYIPAVTLFLI